MGGSPSRDDWTVALDPGRDPVEEAERRFLRLASVIRHELTTPLSVIEGFAVMLDPEDTGEVPTAEEVTEAFAAIRRNAALAMLLVGRLQHAEELLDEEQMELEREEADIAALVHAIVDDVRETLLGGHPVSVDAPGDGAVAPIDAPRVRQILFNLLSNAVKYTDPGTSIAVDVRPNDGYVEVRVRDGGEGIAPAEIEYAFEAFSRMTDEKEGTGLGLAISRAIARAHGGDLTAEPAQQGPGTHFVLRLPSGRQ